jgi:hypothetical protein
MTSPVSRWLLARLGWFAHGATLHRGALAAAHSGEYAAATRLFELAGRAYRRDLDVRGLARLRVHEGVVRLGAGDPSGDEEAALVAELERRLERLDEIESVDPPFAPVPACELVRAWRGHGGNDRPARAARAA